eukprot:gene21729-28750_t
MAMGTWSKRQVRLLSLETVDEGGTMLADAQEDDDDDQPLPSLASAGTLVSQALQLHQQQLEEAEAKAGNGGDPSHEEVRDAAWRWRFQRRWHAEQNRALDTEQSSLPKDKTEDALQYLCAGAGAGWNMQVLFHETHKTKKAGMTTTTGRVGGWTVTATITTNANPRKLVTQILSANASTKTFTYMQASVRISVSTSISMPPNATHSQVSVLQTGNSQELEGSQNSFKFGSLLLEGDMTGSLRSQNSKLLSQSSLGEATKEVHGRGGKQQILVKGHNNCSEDGLVADVNKTINQVAFKYKLPVESMQLMGGGLMEWSKDGGNCLSLHSGYVRSQDCRHHTTQPSEILNLAGALAKKHLPITYKMMVNGRPQLRPQARRSWQFESEGSNLNSDRNSERSREGRRGPLPSVAPWSQVKCASSPAPSQLINFCAIVEKLPSQRYYFAASMSYHPPPPPS